MELVLSGAPRDKCGRTPRAQLLATRAGLLEETSDNEIIPDGLGNTTQTCLLAPAVPRRTAEDGACQLT